jgi:hypothetical protein
MKKIKELTPEQIALMTTVRDEYIHFALHDGDEIKEDDARKSLEWLYSLAGLSKPITIIVDSPMAAQMAVPIARKLLDTISKSDFKQVESQVRSQVQSQVWSQVRSQVWSQVESQVQSQVESQVWSRVESQVWSQVWSQVESQVQSQVWSQVQSRVWSQVRSQVGAYEPFASNTIAYYAGYTSYLDFFDRIGIVKEPKLAEYLKFMKSGAFMGIYLDGLAIVCRRPQAVRRDTNNDLDSDQLPAIEWRDGYKLHYLHGVYFEEPLWKKIISQDITLPELAKLDIGADQNAIAIQMLRPDRLLEQMKAVKIDTGKKYSKLLEQFGEDYCAANFPWSLNNPTELYEVKNFMDTGETEYCMLMEHPSIKGKQYIEWIEPEVGVKADADLAQAHAFGMTIEEYFQAVEA